MPKTDHRETLLRALLLLLLLLGAGAAIVYLKKSSDQPLTPEDLARRDSLRQIDSPDTTLTPDLPAPAEPAPTDTLTPDTLTTDQRVPSDAGYEDGYFAGLEDGISSQERFSYDETSQFPNPAQRRNYAEAYRRGYAQGYADGQAQTPPPDTPEPTHH